MNNQHDRKILIPLRDREPVELFLPYIEELARPGSDIVFLVPISHNYVTLFTDQLLAMHTGLMPGLRSGQNNDGVFARRISSAEQEIFSACAALRAKGMKVVVSVFAGSLRKVVRGYAQKQDIHLIIMRSTAENLLTRAARKVGLFANVFTANALPPVLLFHPSSSIGLK